jgi:hypothetical protein
VGGVADSTDAGGISLAFSSLQAPTAREVASMVAATQSFAAPANNI